MKYFLKECLSTPLQVGFSVPWIKCNKDTGVIATDAPNVIAALESCIAKRKGGVSEIDATRFEDVKKNPAPSLPQRQGFKPRLTPALGKVASSAFSGGSRKPLAAAVGKSREPTPAMAMFSGPLPSLEPSPGGPPTKKGMLEAQAAAEKATKPDPLPKEAVLTPEPAKAAPPQPEPANAPEAPAVPSAPLRRKGRKAASKPEEVVSQSVSAS